MKTMCGTLWHILASGMPAAGHFTLHVQESSKCYRPNVRKVTGELCLAPFCE